MRLTIPILLTFFAGFFCIGCSSKSTPAERGIKDGTLLIGLPTEPDSLDPALIYSVPVTQIAYGLFEGLVISDPKEDAKVLPGVASKWEVSADGLTWTFHLRSDARWSNGDPVVASDFIYSYQRMLSPRLGARFASQLYVIKHAKNYHQGTLSDFSQVGIRAPDSHTLIFELEHPMPTLLLSMTMAYWLPVHPPTIEAAGGIDSVTARWTTPERMVCNGPFCLEAWSVNHKVVLKPNNCYWDRAHLKLKSVEFIPFPDAYAEERAFRTGLIHYCSRVPANLLANYENKKSRAFHQEPLMATCFLTLNTKHEALKDVRVRNALSLVIDRTSIVEKVTLGGEIPATRFTPNGFPGYPAPDLLHYDLQLAKDLLAQAGYPNGKGLPELEIILTAILTPHAINEVQAIAQMWEKSLGVRTRIHATELQSYLLAQTQGTFDCARTGWMAAFLDPEAMLYLWTQNNPNNKSGWYSAQFDNLLAEANTLNNPSERLAKLADAETLLIEDMPIIPIYWYSRSYLLDPHVGGWYPKKIDNRPLKFLYFK
ncbi:MAG TPA: peptide ABC transporter substrate-binding protein [Opitutales bacterium]|nr:peptide ABC transporter substrate-binding protein [Opitutales bacterium]